MESLRETYVANQLRRILRAAGDLDINEQAGTLDHENADDEDDHEDLTKEFAVTVVDEPPVDPRKFAPRVIINKDTGVQEWQISETDLRYLADGYVLGCAGGGSSGCVENTANRNAPSRAQNACHRRLEPRRGNRHLLGWPDGLSDNIERAAAKSRDCLCRKGAHGIPASR